MENSLHQNQTGNRNRNRNQDRNQDRDQSTTKALDNEEEQIPLRTPGGGLEYLSSWRSNREKDREKKKKEIERKKKRKEKERKSIKKRDREKGIIETKRETEIKKDKTCLGRFQDCGSCNLKISL